MSGRAMEVAGELVSRGSRGVSGALAPSTAPRARRRPGPGDRPALHVAKVAAKDLAWRR